MNTSPVLDFIAAVDTFQKATGTMISEVVMPVDRYRGLLADPMVVQYLRCVDHLPDQIYGVRVRVKR